VHRSLSLAGRRASVLAAAALVCLTTACGTADVGLSAAGTSSSTVGRVAAAAPAADAPAAEAPAGEADVAPGGEVAVPAPPVDAAVGTPSIDVVEPAGQNSAVSAADVAPAPAEVPEVESAIDTGAVSGTQVVAHGEGTNRRGDSSPRRRSAEAPAAPAGTTAPATPAITLAAATTAATSGGSGGSYTDQARRSFTARNGLTGRYLTYAAGIDRTRPVALVVYADGTGEYGVDNPTSSYALGGSAGLVANARSRNAITLAVESPNQSCECWHTGNTSGYADFLADLVEKQLASYPVSEVWLTGFSSGSQEVTRFLVPRHPELLRFGGGWVLFGGGGPPAASGANVTAARMSGVRGHWYTGTADTAVPLTASWGAQAGERWYAARGVTTSHEWPEGVGHTLGGKLGRTVGRIMDEA